MAYNQHSGSQQGPQYYGNQRPPRGPPPAPQRYDQGYDQGYDYGYDQGYNGYDGNDGYGYGDGYEDYNGGGHSASGYSQGQYGGQQGRPLPEQQRPPMNGGGRGRPPPTQQYPQGQYRNDAPRGAPPVQNFSKGHGPNPGRQPPPQNPPPSQARAPSRQAREPLVRPVSPETLSMDNPFPIFPSKKNPPKPTKPTKPAPSDPPTQGMAAMNINDGRPNREQSRRDAPQSRGGINSAGPQGHRNFSKPAQQFVPPERSATAGPGMDDFGRSVQHMPPRPSTATGSRPPPQARINPQYPPSAGGPGFSQQNIQPSYNKHESMGDIYSDYYNDSGPVSAAPEPQQNGAYKAYQPTREEEIEANMPNFDAQPVEESNIVPLNFDPQMDAARKGSPAPARQDSHRQGGYPPVNGQPDQYGGGSNQMYHQAQKVRSQPNLRGGGPAGYSYDDYGPVPDLPPNGATGYPQQPMSGAVGYGNTHPINTSIPRGPNGPRSATDPYGQGSPMGQPLSPNNRSAAPPFTRNQTAQSQWSDPGPGGVRNALPGATNPDALPAHPGPPRPAHPDALPAHPVPVRPGLMESKPPPVRQYPGGAAVPVPGPSSNNRASAEVTSRRDSDPITAEELERLRLHVRANPGDNATALQLAKSLVAAADHLGRDNPRMDPKQLQRMRERYNFDAHKVVKKLVSHNYPPAQFYLGDCYGTGALGLPVDPREAFPLYQSAAKLGHAPSAYRTAVCCELGSDDGGGTRKDPLKAVQWYKRAAALGDAAAMYKMGMILLRGLLGQQPNDMEALNWLKRAAEKADQDNPHALHELGLLYEKQRPNSRIIPDPKYAAQLFEEAARLNYKQSQQRLGLMYEYGLLGKPVDPRNSIIWYSRAAAQGEHESELALSGWYLTGLAGILEQSDTEAYLWARKAALANPPVVKALFALGYYSEVGIGCPRSLEEAKRWYGRAAAFKFPKAAERLDELKKNGAKSQRGRERLSRNNQKHRDDCVVM
ncbi:hypothetical protein P152DRAFT_476994 [Eremomyces bilateralis CBS 781.70]|uniref:HCP-like protein n=1 Tax=Eremomyces bilateralis CBS 781.70 TaxID=1392243 RepID=A0A6G1FSN9_9PEZI|nr:uncharacterized protein P152DRAFT_476994 [Eremomyces bilateralis CBS 781.70]KAF1808740.1 hypothetical protein P152DRAFT_476994 [Eremomyces bilateralis CBS 781.70]